MIVVGRKGSYGKVQFSVRPVFAIDTTYFIDPSATSANLRWLYYALQTLDLSASSQDVGVPGLSRDMAYAQRLPRPPVIDQRAIANFLDAETALIDSLGQTKERFLQTLRDRYSTRVSTITKAALATGAVDQMPSAGWRYVPLRRCFESMDYGIGDAAQPDGEICVLGMGNVDGGRVVGRPGGYVDQVDATMLLRQDDLLFNRTNSLVLVGKVARFEHSDRPTTFASYLVRLRVSPIANARYLNYLLNSDEVLGVARSMALPSIGQANLNPSRYGTLHIPLPSIDEQRRIVAVLNEEEAHIHALSQRLRLQMSQLRERRQAVVTAAVTGQFDIPVAA